MKLFLFIFLIFSLSYVTLSQPIFSNKYLHEMIICQLITDAPDGGYYFSGMDINGDALIGKTDSVGNLTWANTVGNNLRIIPRDMTVLNNGNVVVALSVDSGAFSTVVNAYVVAFSLSGNHVFTKKFINTGSGITNLPNNIISDGTGFIISISNNLPNEVRILKSDENGNVLKSIFVGNRENRINKLSTGEYLLNGLCCDVFSFLDSNLTYTNSIYLTFFNPPDYYGWFELTSGSIIFYGAITFGIPLVFKTNSQLQVDWSHNYQFTSFPYPGKIYSGGLVDDNIIAFLGGGDYTGLGGQYTYIILMDTSGNILNSIISETLASNNDFVLTRNLIHENKIIFVTKNSNTTLTDNFFTISSTDTTFTSLCDYKNVSTTSSLNSPDTHMPFSVQSGSTFDFLLDDVLPINNVTFIYVDCLDTTLVHTTYVKGSGKISVYPNPGNNNINIHWENETNEHGIIELFNLQGEIIKKDFIVSGEIKKLHFEDISKGVYFLKLNSQSSSLVRKVMIY